MIPNLDPDANKIPCYAKDIGNGFVLLHARDTTSHQLTGTEAAVVKTFFENATAQHIAHLAWKEKAKALEKVRMAHNVKVSVPLSDPIAR